MSGTICQLGVYCPLCDSALAYSNDINARQVLEVNWHCERCNCIRVSCEGSRDYLDGRVTREIDRLIRTNEWLNYVEKT